jgi:Methyltransferase FkbM domain
LIDLVKIKSSSRIKILCGNELKLLLNIISMAVAIISNESETSVCFYFQACFEQKENQGRISKSVHCNQPGHVGVQCLPLWSLLLALNRTTIDYFSLDVEGSELAVLKTIPFDKIDIKV